MIYTEKNNSIYNRKFLLQPYVHFCVTYLIKTILTYGSLTQKMHSKSPYKGPTGVHHLEVSRYSNADAKYHYGNVLLLLLIFLIARLLSTKNENYLGKKLVVFFFKHSTSSR